MGPRKSNTNVNNSSRRRRRLKNKTLVDRISALPDSILGVILSLIPTKNAVATSTLSKRWEFLWRTVYNLDFCHQFKAENEKFVEFVNHVLLHHDDAGVLNRFSLVWTHYCIQSHAISWIKAATTRNVRELDLTLQTVNHEPLPINIFICESLKSLKLNGRICLSLAATTVFCLPRLEYLALDDVTFESDEAFEKLIKGCPVLHSLVVIRMDDHNYDDDRYDFTYIISSTSLRCLELNFGCLPRQLMLEASSLEQLMIYNQCFVNMNFVLHNLASLVEADFEIHMDEDDDYILDDDKCNSVVDAVRAFDRAKILTLSADTMQALSCATTNLRTDFTRLVKLETSTYGRWSSLLDLIQCSNNLEVLIVHQTQIFHCNGTKVDHSNWTTPVEVPRCLLTSLKEVAVDHYDGNEDEREMIRYMLNHGSVLEVMQVSHYRYILRKSVKFLEEIRTFPRKSLACEVKLKVEATP